MKFLFALTLLLSSTAFAEKIETLRTLNCSGVLIGPNGVQHSLTAILTDVKTTVDLGGEDFDIFDSQAQIKDGLNNPGQTLYSTIATDSDSQNTRDVKHDKGWEGTIFYTFAKTPEALAKSQFIGVLGLSSSQNQLDKTTRNYAAGIRYYGDAWDGSLDREYSGSLSCTVK